jgi:hypothetical protein
MARSETLPQAMGGRVVEPVAIVTVLALLQYFFFGYQVGAARIRYDVAAPATTGHPLFERNFRIHQNTLEQLIAFLPGLWLFGWYVHALVAAALGFQERPPAIEQGAFFLFSWRNRLSR